MVRFRWYESSACVAQSACVAVSVSSLSTILNDSRPIANVTYRKRMRFVSWASVPSVYGFGYEHIKHV